MKRNRLLRTTLTGLAALTLAVSTAAAALPLGARLELRDDAGNVVGLGQVERDELEFDLLPGQAGFATLTVTAADGSVLTYDVHYSGSGEVMLVVDGAVVSLADFAASNGLALDLDVDDDLDDADADDEAEDDADDDVDDADDDDQDDDQDDDAEDDDEDDDQDDDEDDDADDGDDD